MLPIILPKVSMHVILVQVMKLKHQLGFEETKKKNIAQYALVPKTEF